jgi:NADH-quinone oxidoreductase subunit L
MNAVWVILGAPLVAALLILFTGRWRALSAVLSIGAILLGFILSLQVFAAFGQAPGYPLSPAPLRWLTIGHDVHIELGALVDRLSLLMLLVVTGVASAIQIYSLGYLRGDPGFSRYFGCMSLFAFAMLGIVLSSNFIEMFFFWELVGLSSYLLIGYWYERPSAAEAGKKALLVNRIGDFGFMLGILILWYHAGTFDFAQLQARLPSLGLSSGTLAAIGLLIFCGAAGKSAQFPLHVWLPDAMEGPTPVSALIHAATMVAAGVYMLCRVAWLLAPSGVALEAIAAIGGITALMAALIAVTQSDIKRILAYSTLSQLGYMVMAVGLGGSLQAMFHLTTHAFFKALLFLGAGSAIIALHHEQDIWKMGGLRRKMPVTFWTFAIGTLALAGVWPLSGFYSKDEILLLALHRSPALFALGALTAGLTAFYMGRAFCVVFLGRPRDERAFAGVRESPLVMTLPMAFLALLSVVAGWFSAVPRFLEPIGGLPHAGPALGFALLAIPALGFLLAGLLYGRRAPTLDPLARPLGLAYRMVQNKFYIDELYMWLVRYLQGGLAVACEACDRYLVQGLGVGGASGAVSLSGQLVRLLQNGRVRTYAFFLGAGMELVVYFALVR